jgi:MFS family permease
MSSQTTGDRVDPQVLKVAMVLIVGGLAVVFDTTIVSVALHSLAAQLNTSIETIQWVSTGYLLALGVTIPLVGWAQGRFGASACGCSRCWYSWQDLSRPAWPGAHPA